MVAIDAQRKQRAARLASTAVAPVPIRVQPRRSELTPTLASEAAVPRTRAIGGEDASQQETPPNTKRPDLLGNQFWRRRSADRGRPRKFETPEILMAAAIDYFEWVDANPLIECKATQYQGKPILLKTPKMRAMSLSGLCLHLGLARSAWRRYRTRPGFELAVELIESAIYCQKFEGAAAGLFNPRIIARELGLKERTDITPVDQPAREKIVPITIQWRKRS